jgi:hypothetical protein
MLFNLYLITGATKITALNSTGQECVPSQAFVMSTPHQEYRKLSNFMSLVASQAILRDIHFIRMELGHEMTCGRQLMVKLGKKFFLQKMRHPCLGEVVPFTLVRTGVVFWIAVVG